MTTRQDERIRELEAAAKAHKSGEMVYPSDAFRRIEREIADYKAANEREAKVLARGWEPWELPEDMHLGMIEAPRQTGSAPRWISVGSVVIGAVVGLSALSVMFFFPPPDGATLGNWITWSIMSGMIGTIFGLAMFLSLDAWRFFAGGDRRRPPQHPIDRSRMVYRMHVPSTSVPGGFQGSGDVWSVMHHDVRYVGPIPGPLYTKYRQNLRLFDNIYVASKDEALFTATRPVIKGDPFLVGNIGNSWYLGGQWDIHIEMQ